MSFFADCIEAAVKVGRITREQAEDLYQRQRDATDRFTLDPQHSAESAARMAEELGLERAKQDLRLQKYQAALQAIRNSDNTTRILDYQHGPTLGVRTLLARDAKSRATWPSVQTQERNILGQAHATMAEALSQLRTRWLGLHRDKALLNDAIREMFPDASTGNKAAKKIAKAWAKAAEDLRLRFNRAGGAIPRREDWGLPQTWDAVKVGNVPVGVWVDAIKSELNLERMIDVNTGAPFTADSIEVVLQGVYETIRTNGLSDMLPGVAGGKKLANRRQEARFLTFKDADAWLRVQEQFGSGNLFGTLTDHLRQMSKDIALLEVLGPNPSASFRMLQDVATRAEDKPVARAHNQAVFNIVNGTGDRNRSPFLANLFGAIRNWNVASMLGSASISAISDLAFMGLTDFWTGLPITRQLGRYLSQLNPANEADRILATRIGITGLSWESGYSNAGRFSEMGSAVGSGPLARVTHAGGMMAEFTIRASGLSAMTDAGRRSFAMEFSANLAVNFGRKFDEIEGNFGRSLRERGMTSEEWDLLRTTPTTDHKGAKFFTVDQLLAREDIPLSKRQQLASRIQTIINEEILFAVPEPDALARVYTTGGGQPRASLLGEVGRSVFQFKSFPIAVLSLHAMRALSARQLRGGWSAAAYAASAIISTTALGMFAMQLKLISKGKDPRDMDDPKAWAAAFIQGGGGGIYGDFLFHDANRFGSGPITTLSGPSVGLAEDAIRMTWGNAQQLMAGEDPKIAADMIGFAKRYMPGGSLWYTRLLLEREIFDQLALEADPRGTRRRFNRQQRRAREQGTDFWWRPGERKPERAPR
jgi:hypothetical protein